MIWLLRHCHTWNMHALYPHQCNDTSILFCTNQLGQIISLYVQCSCLVMYKNNAVHRLFGCVFIYNPTHSLRIRQLCTFYHSCIWIIWLCLCFFISTHWWYNWFLNREVGSPCYYDFHLLLKADLGRRSVCTSVAMFIVIRCTFKVLVCDYGP